MKDKHERGQRLSTTKGILWAACLATGGCSLSGEPAWEVSVAAERGGEGLATARPGGGVFVPGPSAGRVGVAEGGYAAGELPAVGARPGIGVSVIADPVPGHRGFVYTPHLGGRKMVDVRRFAVGEQVLCPYTHQPFLVPDFGADRGRVGRAGPGLLVAGSSTGARVEESTSIRMAPGGGPVPVVRMDGDELARRMGGNAWSEGTEGGDEGAEDLPAGTWVVGRPGFVQSPFAGEKQLVDVTGVEPGTVVRCPYTGHRFRLPPADGAGEEPGEAVDDSEDEAAAAAPVGVEEEAPRETGEADSEAGREGGAAVEPRGGDGADGEELPVAERIPGRPGLVQSPFGRPGQLVDVAGKSSGEVVVCPFSYRRFRVP